MQIPRQIVVARRSVIALLLTLLLAMVFFPQQLQLSDLQSAPLRILIDLICVVLFFSIFIVSWHGYEIHRQSRSVILAIGFLCAAIFNFFSIVSETSTSHFATEQYQQITFLFSLLWRITTAFILLFIATGFFAASRQKNIALTILKAGLSLVALAIVLAFYFFNQIPALQSSGNWSYLIKNLIEAALIGLFALASGMFYVTGRSNSAPDDVTEKSFLFAACALLTMAEFCYSDVYVHHPLFRLLGQLYQFAGTLCIYFSLVTINLSRPFSQLAQAKYELLKSRNRLNDIIQTATDGIITIDASHHIIMVNKAAEKYFGYEDQKMLGLHLDQVIPMRHRSGHSQHVNDFGKTGRSIRQMGVQSADFSVTGLKKSGDEFPIEASISSMQEGDQRLFTVIFRDINDRKIAKEKMEQYHQQLSELSQSLQTEREEERKHIARELHDDLGQLLAALRMDFSVLEKKAPDNPAVRPILRSMDNLILNAITTLRRIATDLRPRALDEGGLYFALQTLQKDFKHRHLIECLLRANENELSLDDNISTTVYRVIQESLTNVVRHASATQVEIDLSRTDNVLRFSIRDNGRGINQQDFAKRQSFGLVGMRERVRALRGELSITGDETAGTCIEVVIPVSPR